MSPDDRRLAELRRHDERQNQAAAFLLTLLVYAVIVLAGFVLNWRFFQEISDNPGPVSVRMGSLEGLDIPDATPAPQPETAPEATAPEPSAEPQPEPSAEPEPAPVAEPEPAPSASTAPSAAPSPKPSPSARPSPKPSAKPSPAASAKPSAEPLPSPTISPLVSSTAAPGVKAEVKIPPRGDNGNQFETTFYNVNGSVGRVLGGEMSRYMPLPETVLGSLYDKIGNGSFTFLSRERQLELFTEWYVQAGQNWQLKTPPERVPVDQRDQLWNILEGAGYSLRKAEYRQLPNVRPVILEFTLGKNPSGPATVKDVRVVQSSGYSSIDDAVVYGFRQATFSNNTDGEVKGRYTYTIK